MIRTIALGVTLALGLVASLVTASNAAEGCGRGWWRGPGGVCHPMVGPHRFCPPGYHIGREGHRCWPN